ALGAVAAPVGAYVAGGVSPLVSKLARSVSGSKPVPSSTGRTIQDFAEQSQQQVDTAVAPSVQSRAIAKVEDSIRKDFPDDYEEVIKAWKMGDAPLAELYGKSITSRAKGAAQFQSGQAEAEKYFLRE